MGNIWRKKHNYFILGLFEPNWDIWWFCSKLGNSKVVSFFLHNIFCKHMGKENNNDCWRYKRNMGN
ncbi:MAG: hypothetical protein EBR82_60540 [Caulobacteraceae bacterium]|nr:hypothetical protein [Caulobacteraceae bacterium]